MTRKLTPWVFCRRNPCDAHELRAERLGVLRYIVGLVDCIVVADSKRRADHSACIQHLAKLGGGLAEEIRKLHVADAERMDGVEGARHIGLEFFAIGIRNHARRLGKERGRLKSDGRERRDREECSERCESAGKAKRVAELVRKIIAESRLRNADLIVGHA
jgi:hypothetical protein